MIGVVIAVVAVGLAVAVATYRMFVGPTDADRAVGADLLTFGVIALLLLIGVWSGISFTFDMVLVVALVAFLSAISLGRALTRGRR